MPKDERRAGARVLVCQACRKLRCGCTNAVRIEVVMIFPVRVEAVTNG